MSVDVIWHSPYIHKGILRNLEGELSKLSEVTSEGLFFSGTPSILGMWVQMVWFQI